MTMNFIVTGHVDRKLGGQRLNRKQLCVVKYYFELSLSTQYRSMEPSTGSDTKHGL